VPCQRFIREDEAERNRFADESGKPLSPKTTRLCNRYLYLSNKHFAMKPACNLGRISSLEEEGQCFDEVRARLFNR
jgi:hypothetical protein